MGLIGENEFIFIMIKIKSKGGISLIQKKVDVKDVLKYLYESRYKKRVSETAQPVFDKNKEELEPLRKII